MAFTAAQVRQAALEHLGIVGAGQSPSAEDDALAERKYVSLYGRLHRKRLVPFLRTSVEDWAIDPLAKVLAWEMVSEFGFTGIRRDGLREDKKEGLAELQSGAASLPSPLQPRGQFY